MNLIQKVFLFILVTNIVVNGTTSIQYSACTAYHASNRIFQYTYRRINFVHYPECTACKPDPHRSNDSPNCLCDKGYIYDGTSCIEQKIGVQYFEDFENPLTLSENWDKKDSATKHNALLMFNDKIQSNVLTFNAKVSYGDIFHKKTIQSLKYDEKIWVILDYHANLACKFLAAKNTIGQNPGSQHWYFGTVESIYYDLMSVTPGDSWNHYEYHMDLIYYDLPVTLTLEDNTTGVAGNCQIDNFIQASTHGPTEYNIGAFKFIYPSFMVLSNDYDGFDGSHNLQQFNFDIDTMNQILGRIDWNGEQFALYIPENDIVVEVQIFDETQYNGATFGKGHGRFVDNASFQSEKYFYPGLWLSFDRSFSRNQADFKQITGTAMFEGPLMKSQQNLAGCFNQCQDFATYGEAIKECQNQADCHGIKYTHKYWGGANSQGFHRGYGFQLRQTGSEVNNRQWEFSYKKRSSLQPGLYHRPECKSSGTSLVYEEPYDERTLEVLECTECDLSDPNRLDSLPLCPCKRGYYDDGTQCQRRTIGVIFEDDFNTGIDSDKWVGSSDENYISSAQQASKHGNSNAINFSQKKDKGDLFSTKTYQTQKYNDEALIMFDYVDEGPAGLSFGFSFQHPSDYQWVFTSSTADAGNTYPAPQIPKTEPGKWGHFEGKFSSFPDIPFRSMFQEHISTTGESYLDNFLLSTIHGPDNIRKSPYSHLQPSLMIQGNDFTGFDGTGANQQFSFDKADLDTLLGRPFENGETFSIYLEKAKITAQIQVFNGNNGSIYGDSHAKFVDNTPYTGNLVFQPGEWVIFSKDFTDDVSQHKLETGSCQFEGPFREQDQNLEQCFNDCQDFATLQEAMNACVQESLCSGVTYSHKLWGGSLSTGFHRGYGFQLRQTELTPSRTDFPRQFEYSFKKIENPGYFQSPTSMTCQECDNGCATCRESGSCLISCPTNCQKCTPDLTCSQANDGYYLSSPGTIINKCDDGCATCSTSGSCILSCLTNCNKCKPNQECIEQEAGYYIDPIDKSVKKCDSNCATCDRQGSCLITCPTNCKTCEADRTCTSANAGYYLSPTKQIIKCDDQCATCTQSGSCELSCPLNCSLCLPDQECTQSKDGYFVNPGDKTIQQCDEGCATCIQSGSCTISCPTNCKRCLPDQTCTEGKDGYYLDNQNIIQQCDHFKCATCEFSEDQCIIPCKEGCKKCNAQNVCQEANDGYFIDLTGKFQQCDNRYCATCSNTSTNCSKTCETQCATCDPEGKCLTCTLGQTLENQNCVPCNSKCAICDPNNKDKCLTCSEQEGVGRSKDIESNCGCKEGYYENPLSLDCQKCQLASCKNCNSNLVCIECRNPNLQPPLCQQSLEGAYLTEIEKDYGGNIVKETSVNQCAIQCMTCSTDQYQCLQCKKGLNRSPMPPCNCIEGYHDSEGTSTDCLKCPEYCLECVSKDKCVRCKEGSLRQFNEFTQKCDCLPGYKENPVTLLCQRCFMYKGECLEACPQLNLTNQKEYLCEQVKYNLLDNIILIITCGLLMLIFHILCTFFISKMQKHKGEDQQQQQQHDEIYIQQIGATQQQ